MNIEDINNIFESNSKPIIDLVDNICKCQEKDVSIIVYMDGFCNIKFYISNKISNQVGILIKNSLIK